MDNTDHAENLTYTDTSARKRFFNRKYPQNIKVSPNVEPDMNELPNLYLGSKSSETSPSFGRL